MDILLNYLTGAGIGFLCGAVLALLPANQEQAQKTILISAIVGSVTIGGRATALAINSGDFDE
jgi:predicted membrane protein